MSNNDLKELYCLGFYTKVVHDAVNVKSDEETEFVALRSRLALNQTDYILNVTRALGSALHKGINMLARAIRVQTSDDIETILQEVDETLLRTSPLYAICVAVINLRIDKFAETLEILNGIDHSEAAAVRIQALLAINRIDLAEAELEEVTLPVQRKICKAFINLSKSKEFAHEALLEFQDLSESFNRFGESAMLSNAIAVGHFALGEWESGCAAMEAAAEKFPSDEVTAINRAVALAHTTEYEKMRTQLEIVKSSAQSRYTQQIDEMLRDFDTTAARFQTK